MVTYFVLFLAIYWVNWLLYYFQSFISEINPMTGWNIETVILWPLKDKKRHTVLNIPITELPEGQIKNFLPAMDSQTGRSTQYWVYFEIPNWPFQLNQSQNSRPAENRELFCDLWNEKIDFKNFRKKFEVVGHCESKKWSLLLYSDLWS